MKQENEIYEALKLVIKNARQYADEKNKKKRKNQSEIWDVAVLYRDIVIIEDWMKEKSIKL